MFCLTGRGSVLNCEVYPPCDISNGTYVLGLVEITTFNSIPNIETGVNDKFYYGNEEITFPEGSYEVEDMEKFILDHIKPGTEFSLKPNNNTLKAEIRCSEIIDFKKPHTIGPMLGFTTNKLDINKKHTSDVGVDILRVSSIRVHCNIVQGSYDNGTQTHTLHEIHLTVPPGFKIISIPTTIIYLPVNVKQITNLTIELRDQDNRLINLRNEVVTLRLHLKRIDGFSI